MGVINSLGIVGIIDNVSKNYATVISILNTKSKINAKIKHSDHFGTLTWDGKNTGFVGGNVSKDGSVFGGSTNASDYAVDVLFDRTDSVRRLWTMERAQYQVRPGFGTVLVTSERQTTTPALANRIVTMPIFYRYGQAAITNNPAFPPVCIGKYSRGPTY